MHELRALVEGSFVADGLQVRLEGSGQIRQRLWPSAVGEPEQFVQQAVGGGMAAQVFPDVERIHDEPARPQLIHRDQQARGIVLRRFDGARHKLHRFYCSGVAYHATM